jgi:hypothetical protein
LLGAHVEAQRRQYAQALEALSLEAALVLPPDELQALYDCHAQLEGSMRAALRRQEASRSRPAGKGATLAEGASHGRSNLRASASDGSTRSFAGEFAAGDHDADIDNTAGCDMQ